jgi:predicted O-linked N-acetylglucosamine transferase (SPINDLY family)
VAASILTGIKCNELICEDESHYLQRAVYFYEQPEELKDIREKISAEMLTDRLTPYVQSLESAYLEALIGQA